MSHAYKEDPLVEQPAVGLFLELGWIFERKSIEREYEPRQVSLAVPGW